MKTPDLLQIAALIATSVGIIPALAVDLRQRSKKRSDQKRTLLSQPINSEMSAVAQAEAAAKLLDSLQDVQAAVIRAGSLILVKSKDQILATVLNAQEIDFLEREPALLQKPEELRRRLSTRSLVSSEDVTVSLPKDESQIEGSEPDIGLQR